MGKMGTKCQVKLLSFVIGCILFALLSCASAQAEGAVGQFVIPDKSQWGEIVSQIESIPVEGEGPGSRHTANDTATKLPQKHDPLLEVNHQGFDFTIKVRGPEGSAEIGKLHPMTGEHFIEYLYVKDQDSNIVHLAKWVVESEPSGLNKLASADFQLNSKDLTHITHLTPYSVCNKHGIWKGPEMYNVKWQTIASQKYFRFNKNGIVTKYRLNPFREEMASSKHVPTLAFQNENGKITGTCTVRGENGSVEESHGMSAEHFIETIFAVDQHGRVIAHEKLNEETHPKASITFPVPAGTTKLTCWEHCNKHGVWEGETVDITADSCDDSNSDTCNTEDN